MISKNYWHDKFCIVTGAASGIGFETSKLLISEGAKVLGLDKSPAVGTVKAIFSASNNPYEVCDLSKPQEIEAVFRSFTDSKL
ncbi:MAG: SDR family NAD(P)-dependent oxidoreductase, partial [Actinomycetes bacterium]